MTANLYDAVYASGVRMDCDLLIASGEYSCAGAFAPGMGQASLCDLSCGFNAYDTRHGMASGCESMVGLYSCAADFAAGMAYEGQCDFLCGFCTGGVRARRMQDLSTCVARVEAIGIVAVEAAAERPWSREGVSRDASGVPTATTAAINAAAAMMGGLQRMTETLQVAAQTSEAHTCELWEEQQPAIIVHNRAHLDVTGCAFISNIRAIFVHENARVSLRKSAFIGNRLEHGGAAMWVEINAHVNVTECAFVGNVAHFAGAIFAHGMGGHTHLQVTRSAFVHNVATIVGGLISGGAIKTDYVSLHLTDSTFIGNWGFMGWHMHTNGPTEFFVYNTSFDPFERGTHFSLYLDVLAGCDIYPCPVGFGCSYENYSLSCTPCPGSLISRDGIRCELPYTCPPGKECAVVDGCVDASQCSTCKNGTVSDGSGECTPCTKFGERANDARSACVPCVAGTEPSLDRSRCVACGKGNVSEGALCRPCTPSGAVPTSIPNEHRTACMPCVAGTKPSVDEDACICDSGHYNATSSTISCYESAFEEFASSASSVSGCTRCGSCIDCADSPHVSPGYVRLNLGMPSASSGRESSVRNDSPVANVHVFRCKSMHGCFGLDSFDPIVGGCQQNYTGYFCASCILGFERRDSESVPGCQACSTPASKSWVIAVVIITSVVVVAKTRNRLARAIAPDMAHVPAILAVGRSAWQPIRILVSYVQVTSQVGTSLNIHYPPMFVALTNRLAGILDVIDGIIGVECLGLNDFHTRWLTQVVLFPLGLATVAVGMFEVERRRSSRGTARKHLADNVFFIVFVSYPRICQVSFNAWICRRALPDLSILVADDRVACEDGAHIIYKGMSLIVLIVIALGVPVIVTIVLYRERQAQPAVPDSLKLRAAEALAITPQEAEFAVNDIKVGSSYGFLVDAFKPKFFYWESMDMLRKLALLGLVLLFERGSINQIAVSLIISLFFLVAHLRVHPYKLDSDNHFRSATELHVLLTIATGLVFRTDLDNGFATQLAVEGYANVDAQVQQQYDVEAAARKSGYDSMLLVTFIIFVASATVATVIAKMVLVARAIASQFDNVAEGKQDALMRAAYTRFRLGLATGSDHMDLVDFIDQLDVNQHVRAGKRLWREKELVCHFTADHMSALLRDIEQQLPKSETIAYHFTDLDAARVILDQSQGLRASTVGQLGGGVSVCLASPTVLGWDKHGGERMAFCQRVGDELWGSKAHEVLPGVPPAGAHADYGKFHNKLEVVLVVRIPAEQNRDNSRIVPGRNNVYIIDNRDCEPG
eukprot:COSAG02_NODE_5647_length_4153_cov_5.533300_1_plen_1278_part_10